MNYCPVSDRWIVWLTGQNVRKTDKILWSIWLADFDFQRPTPFSLLSRGSPSPLALRYFSFYVWSISITDISSLKRSFPHTCKTACNVAHLASCYFGFDTGVYKVACPPICWGRKSSGEEGKGKGRGNKGREGEREEREGNGRRREWKARRKLRERERGKWKEIK